MRASALKHLQEAIQIDDCNYLAMKYLAEHYFLKREWGAARKLCERGLKCLEHLKRTEQCQKENPSFRREIDFLRSDFHFILGKIAHLQHKFEEANSAYSHAVKFNSMNYPA
mmetsp:Transcript_3641/g.2711  ORF Transcript_3641/g.2711 Transcript_3641/m.2711 type:complete len:112 (+) Transcript_3641:462-797(+)